MLKKVPSIFILVALGVGIGLGDTLPLPSWSLFVAAVAAASAGLLVLRSRKSAGIVCLGVALSLLSAMHFRLVVYPDSPTHVSNFANRSGTMWTGL